MKKILFAFLATGVMQISNFASGVLLARMLGPTMRGEVAQVIAWFSFIVPVLLLGINDSVAYFRSRDPEDSAAVLTGALLISVPLSTVAALACVAVIYTALAGSSPLAIAAAWLFLLYAPFYQWQQILYSYFQAGARPVIWTFVRVVPGVVFIGGLLFIMRTDTVDPFRVIAANVVSLAVTLLICSFLVFRSGERLRLPTTDLASRMLNFGLPVFFQRVAIVCRDNLDRMVLPFFVTANALGHYVVASSVAYLIYVVGMTVDLVGFPAMARVKDDEARRRIAELCISATLILLVLITGCFALIIKPVVMLLFGKSYVASIALVPWFLAAGAAQALRIVVGGAFKAFNLSGPMARFEFIGAIIMVVILLGGSAHFGAFAGALAHLISAYVSLGIALVAAIRTLRLSPRHIFLPRNSDLELVWSAIRRGSRPPVVKQGSGL